MANIKSQIKRVGTNERNRLRNQAVKSEIRTEIKKFRVSAAAKETEEAAKLLARASKKLDVAVSKGVIHKNQAANKKSALAKLLNKISTK